MINGRLPNWLYWPIKIMFVLGLLVPVLMWGMHLTAVLPSKHSAPFMNDTSQAPTNSVSNSVAGSTESGYVNGIDVSHYQGTIDWSKVAAAGIDFAYIKTSNGASYVDPHFHQNWNEIRTTDLHRGAYHFFSGF